jgi:2OG-Fe(II) oxygenase superfamily
MHNIKIIPNFISDEDCATAIAMIDKFDNKHQLEEFNANMSVLVVPENAPDGVKIIKKYSDKAIEAHRSEHGFLPELYTTEGWLSLWESGNGAGVHTDAHVNYEFLIYATVIYLNDSSEYIGGEIYFPNQGITYSPRKGDAVIFPCGGHEYVHGVTEIIDGRRYTIPMWHTKRPDKASKLFHPGVADSVKEMPSTWFSSYLDSKEQKSNG